MSFWCLQKNPIVHRWNLTKCGFVLNGFFWNQKPRISRPCRTLYIYITFYFSECCNILLFNFSDQRDQHTFVAQLSGTRNGHPKYSLREGGDNIIYYENGKWIIAGARPGSVIGISNTSPKCAEMVQSWSAGPANEESMPLVGGKIRCAVEDQALERCLQNIRDCDNVQGRWADS